MFPRQNTKEDIYVLDLGELLDCDWSFAHGRCLTIVTAMRGRNVRKL